MQVKECALSGLTLNINLCENEVDDISLIYDNILKKNLPDKNKLLIIENNNAKKIIRNYYYSKAYLFSLVFIKQQNYWKMNTKKLITLSSLIQYCINYSYNHQLSNTELLWLYFHKDIFMLNNKKIPLNLVSKGCLLNIGGYEYAC